MSLQTLFNAVLYRKAAEYLDDKQIEDDMEVPIDRFLLPKDLQTMLEERVKTFNNMAQSQMKLTAWDSALASIRQVNIASGMTSQV